MHFQIRLAKSAVVSDGLGLADNDVWDKIIAVLCVSDIHADKGFHHWNGGFLKNRLAVSYPRTAGTRRPDYSLLECHDTPLNDRKAKYTARLALIIEPWKSKNCAKICYCDFIPFLRI